MCSSQDCSLNVTAGLGESANFSTGYITAQSRKSSSETTGYVFRRGTVSGGGQNYLGRAYGPYSRVIFQETILDAVIIPQGWDAWNSKGKEYVLLLLFDWCQCG